MAKSYLPQGQISFTPDKELVVSFPKKSLEAPSSMYRFKMILIAQLLILALIMIIIFYTHLNTKSIKFWSLFLVQIPYLFFIFRKLTVEKITLTSNGFIYKYYGFKSPQTIKLEDTSYVDIKVKLLEDSPVELDIDDHLIYFDDIEKLPLVIDNIVTTWNMQYYDTIHIDDNQEILTYISKAFNNFKAFSRIKIEDKPQIITFRDDLAIQKYFSIDKQKGELFTYKSTNRIKLPTSKYSIQIAAYSNLGIFYKESEIRINLIDKNGGLKTVFTSERRHKDETVTTYRDVELIYDKLKALPILENVVIEKVFR